MAISLTKGGNIDLSKAVAETGGTLTKVTAGLGWDARTTDGASFDLDASAIGIGVDGKAISENWFVFYGKDYTQSPDGTIVYGGDNRTGDGDGDDEQIFIDLAGLPAVVEKVVIIVSIFEAAKNGLKFGDVSNSYIRIVDDVTGQEIPGARYDLREEAATETAMVFGELYRYNGNWKFRAVGQGYSNGLAGVMKDYGLEGNGG